MIDQNTLLEELKRPFHPSVVEWKPGQVAKSGDTALALAYADVRAYQNRLDEVCGLEWSVTYTPWGDGRLICHLTILGVCRSSTGETDSQSEKNEIAGTAMEAQALKRACAMFGLGRYLYNLPTMWAEFDPQRKQFTEQARAKLTGILLNHYKRSVDEVSKETNEVSAELRSVFWELGQELYGEKWEDVARRNIERVSNGTAHNTSDLTAEQTRKLINGMNKLKQQRESKVAA